MLAADTSSVIAYLEGDNAPDAEAVKLAIDQDRLCLPGVVIAELISDHRAGGTIAMFIADLPLLRATDGYWERAGHSRRKLLSLGHKARIGDALAAQACIDHKVPLIARDRDFRHFVKHCGLVLA